MVKTPKLSARTHPNPLVEVGPLVDLHAKYLPHYIEATQDSKVQSTSGIISISDESLDLAFRERCLSRCSLDCDQRLQVMVGWATSPTNIFKDADSLYGEPMTCVGPIDGSSISHRSIQFDEQLYLSICVDRCHSTCGQRLQYFKSLGEAAFSMNAVCPSNFPGAACAGTCSK